VPLTGGAPCVVADSQRRRPVAIGPGPPAETRSRRKRPSRRCRRQGPGPSRCRSIVAQPQPVRDISGRGSWLTRSDVARRRSGHMLERQVPVRSASWAIRRVCAAGEGVAAVDVVDPPVPPVPPSRPGSSSTRPQRSGTRPFASCRRVHHPRWTRSPLLGRRGRNSIDARAFSACLAA